MVLNIVGGTSLPEFLATAIQAQGLCVAHASTTHIGGSLLPLEKGGTPLAPTPVLSVILTSNQES